MEEKIYKFFKDGKRIEFKTFSWSEREALRSILRNQRYIEPIPYTIREGIVIAIRHDTNIYISHKNPC